MDGTQVILSHAGADIGCADGAAVHLFAGQLYKFDTVFGQQTGHGGIVGICDRAERLGADKAPGDTQGLGEVLTKDADVQFAVGIGGLGLILDEVGGEYGRGDQIIRCAVEDDIAEVGGTGLGQFITHIGGKSTLVLRQDKEVEGIDSGSGLFDEPAVAQGEGIAVGNDGTHHTAFLRGALQRSNILFNAAALVFHQQDGVGFQDLIKAEVAEHSGILGFGEQEEVVTALLGSIVEQSGQDTGRQAHALMFVGNCNALEDIVVDRARGNDIAIIIGQIDSVFDLFIVIEFGSLQELTQFAQLASAEGGAVFFIKTIIHST